MAVTAAATAAAAIDKEEPPGENGGGAPGRPSKADRGSFYELIDGLTWEYDRARGEIARLRSRLGLPSAAAAPAAAAAAVGAATGSAASAATPGPRAPGPEPLPETVASASGGGRRRGSPGGLPGGPESGVTAAPPPPPPPLPYLPPQGPPEPPPPPPSCAELGVPESPRPPPETTSSIALSVSTLPSCLGRRVALGQGNLGSETKVTPRDESFSDKGSVDSFSAFGGGMWKQNSMGRTSVGDRYDPKQRNNILEKAPLLGCAAPEVVAGSRRSILRGELELLPIWTIPRSPTVNRCRSMESTSSRPLRSEASVSGLSKHWRHSESSKRRNNSWMRRLVVSPSSRKMLMWDTVTMSLLLWDLIIIPLQAYPLPDLELWNFMELLATLLWTFDLVFSFFKGFEVCGDVEMNPTATMVHYLRTWFCFDVTIVSIDWFLFVAASGDMVDFLRFTRFRRAVRLLRLMRLFKHGLRMMQLMEFFQSEDSAVLIKIVWLLVLLIVINHFLSCGWYAIGTVGVSDVNWADKAFDEEIHSVTYRYLTSFHWSVTQFTPASMEVTPRNSLERIYNIVVILLGLCMFSSFVSSITSSMTYLTKRNVERRQQTDDLMGYMNDKEFTLGLKKDISVYLMTAKPKKRRILQESAIAAFKLLPDLLLERIHIHLHAQVVERHALFAQLQREEQGVVHQLCHHAMSEIALSAGQELFRFGAPCSKMYFQVRGTCEYQPGWGDGQTALEVSQGMWLSEPCLWFVWEHRGRLNAATESGMSVLDSKEFQKILVRSRIFWETRSYALLYAKQVSLEPEGLEGSTDLIFQRVRVIDLVMTAFDDDTLIQAMFQCSNRFTMECLFGNWASWTAKQTKSRQGKSLLSKFLRTSHKAKKSFKRLSNRSSIIDR